MNKKNIRLFMQQVLFTVSMFGMLSCNSQTPVTGGGKEVASDSTKKGLLKEISVDSLKLNANAFSDSSNAFYSQLLAIGQEVKKVRHEIDSLSSLAAYPADSVLQMLEKSKSKNLAGLFAAERKYQALFKASQGKGNYSVETFSPEGRRFSCFVVNPDSAEVKLIWKNAKGKVYGDFVSYKAEMEKAGKELLFASNGGMYQPDQSAQGLFIENGKIQQKLDGKKSGYGNFYLQPNGIFLMTENNKAQVVTTEMYQKMDIAPKYATQSGPMLLIDGEINSVLGAESTNFHIRNGVGVDSKGRLVFIISNERVRFYELAEQFKQLGCKYALYLDGAISQTYAPTLGMNEPGGGFGVIIAVLKK